MNAMKEKKIISIMLISTLLLFTIAGCSSRGNEDEAENAGSAYKELVTAYYDAIDSSYAQILRQYISKIANNRICYSWCQLPLPLW